MSIEVKNLSFSYGEHEVLHDVSFSVAAGEYLSILGPNGCLLYTSDAADE